MRSCCFGRKRRTAHVNFSVLDDLEKFAALALLDDDDDGDADDAGQNRDHEFDSLRDCLALDELVVDDAVEEHVLNGAGFLKLGDEAGADLFRRGPRRAIVEAALQKGRVRRLKKTLSCF